MSDQPKKRAETLDYATRTTPVPEKMPGMGHEFPCPFCGREMVLGEVRSGAGWSLFQSDWGTSGLYFCVPPSEQQRQKTLIPVESVRRLMLEGTRRPGRACECGCVVIEPG